MSYTVPSAERFCATYGDSDCAEQVDLGPGRCPMTHTHLIVVVRGAREVRKFRGLYVARCACMMDTVWMCSAHITPHGTLPRAVGLRMHAHLTWCSDGRRVRVRALHRDSNSPPDPLH